MVAERVLAMRKGRFAPLGAVMLLVALLAGCSSATNQAGSSAKPVVGTAGRLEGVTGRAVDLLPTVWHVHAAAGAGHSTYLLFTAGEVEVLQPKGFVQLAWATQGDAMLTQVYGWAESLGTKHMPTVPWLTSATFFRRLGTGWVLLDKHGTRLAALRNDGPAPRSNTSITTPQPVTGYARKQVADAVAGPGARTPSLQSAAGRWTVAGLDPEHALLTMKASGAWKVEGGCDSDTGQDLGGAGAFRLLPHGYLLNIAGPVAGVGCSTPTSEPPADTAALTRFAEARSLTVQDDRMTLYDRLGHRIGRLTRTADPASEQSPAATRAPRSASATLARGCKPTSTHTPAGVKTASIADVDHDGRRDIEWARLKGGDLQFGITTASGATISAEQGFAGGANRSFVVGTLANGVVVAITSEHRDSPVYTFTNCALHTLEGKDLTGGSSAHGPFVIYSVTGGGTGGCYNGHLGLVEHFTTDGDTTARIIDISKDGRHATLTRRTTPAHVSLPVISCGPSPVLNF